MIMPFIFILSDALIVTSLDTITSILSGIIIFGILGNLAHETGIDDITAVVKGGTGLAFVSYPDAIAKFEFMPQIFSVVFFFMLFILGIGSNVGLCVCLTSVVRDRFRSVTHMRAILMVASVQFAIGCLYVTPVSAKDIEYNFKIITNNKTTGRSISFESRGLFWCVLDHLCASHWRTDCSWLGVWC